MLVVRRARATRRRGDEVAAAVALGRARASALAALFLVLVARTREPRPVRAGVAPLVRAGLAVGFALALTWLVPAIGLDIADGRAGGARADRVRHRHRRRRAGRRCFQVLGIVLVENGLALAALELPAASSLVIELGVALDLTLVALVAAVFHERIFAEFGAGDTAALRSLRD